MMLVLLFALFSAAAAQNYNGLKVTWGINVFDEYVYADVPRTVADALEDGWEDYGSGCDQGYFQGNRYIKFDDNLGDYDLAVMPLYDVNGYIAGLQAAIPLPDDNTGYPSNNIIPPLILDEGINNYTMTAYFVDPTIICSTGRTQEDFERDGTGDRVVLQNGADLTVLPDQEADVTAPWTNGQCFATMGQHYWYDVTSDMSCDDFWPMFLLYNGGQLNAFGWAFQGNFMSRRYEHPTANVLGSFLPDEYPDCLNDIEFFSTLHIYLSNSPLSNFC